MSSNLQQISFTNIQHYSDKLKEVLDEIIDRKGLKNYEDLIQYTESITYDRYGDMERKYGGSYYEKHLLGMKDLVGDAIIENKEFKIFTEIIALLHDIVEDRLMTYEELEEGFSQEVRHLIWTLSESRESRRFKEAHIGKVLTFVDNGKTITREYTKKDMKVDMLRESLLKIKLLKNLPNKLYYQAAASVRVADMLHNLSDFRIQKGDLLDRNMYKTEIILEELNDTLLTKELKEVLEELKWLFDKNKI